MTIFRCNNQITIRDLVLVLRNLGHEYYRDEINTGKISLPEVDRKLLCKLFCAKHPNLVVLNTVNE